jgi:hypothetical protein
MSQGDFAGLDFTGCCVEKGVAMFATPVFEGAAAGAE